MKLLHETRVFGQDRPLNAGFRTLFISLLLQSLHPSSLKEIVYDFNSGYLLPYLLRVSMTLAVGKSRSGVVNGILSTRMWLQRKAFLHLAPLRKAK
jgi:hypothetical protein